MSALQTPALLAEAPPRGAIAHWPAVSIVLLCPIAALMPVYIPSFLSACLLFLAAVRWVASGKPMDPVLAKVLAAFAVAIAVGIVSGAGNDRFVFLKDGWYFVNPVSIIALGFVFFQCMPDIGAGLRAVVLGAGLVSSYHMLWFELHPELFDFSAARIREIAGTGYYAPVLGLVLLAATLGRWRSVLRLPGWVAAYCFLACAAACSLSFSRTILVTLLIMAAALAGWLKSREWRLLPIGAAAAALVFLLANVYLQFDSGNRQERTFLGKLASSVQEVEVEDYRTEQEINQHWRGFETYRALETVAEGTPLQWLIGQGFGAQVDLGFFQALSNDPRGRLRQIPVFHNGFVYLLLKTGLVGVCAYLYALWVLYRTGRRSAQGSLKAIDVLGARLLQGCVVSVAFSTWVISGAFNKADMFPFLLMIGFLIAGLAAGRPSLEESKAANSSSSREIANG
jgi:hypothetical protein